MLKYYIRGNIVRGRYTVTSISEMNGIVTSTSGGLSSSDWNKRIQYESSILVEGPTGCEHGEGNEIGERKHCCGFS